MITIKKTSALLVTLAIFCSVPGFVGASTFAKDESFLTGTGFDDAVRGGFQQSDGKIVLIGSFFSYDGVDAGRIIRLNADGTRDETFDPGTSFNSIPIRVTLQSDGKILVGGFFNSFNGNSAVRIARLNADGSFDGTFNTGLGVSGVNNEVRAIRVQSDDKIVLGGSMTAFDGTTIHHIIRLNSDGSVDGTFDPGTGFDAPVSDVALLSNGKMIVSGSFTQYNGVSANGIARLNADGSRDLSFDVGAGPDSTVGNIRILSDSKILVSGGFTTFDGNSAVRIARLNADGSFDSTFNAGSGFPLYTSLGDIVEQSDGKIIMGGSFLTYNGVSAQHIVRVNSDGSRDTSFISGTGFNTAVALILPQSDGSFVMGGDFEEYKGQTVNYLVRLNEAPGLSSGSVTGDTVRLVFDEPLDETSVPATSAFTVSAAESLDLYANDFSDGPAPDLIFNADDWTDTVIGSASVSDGVLTLSDISSESNSSALFFMIDTGATTGYFPEGSIVNVRMKVNTTGFLDVLTAFTDDWADASDNTFTSGQWVDLRFTAESDFTNLGFLVELDGDEFTPSDTIEIDSVSIGGLEISSKAVTGVSIASGTVTLTLDSSVATTTEVSVSYAIPGSSPIRGLDPIGSASSIVDYIVTNLTTDPSPEPDPELTPAPVVSISRAKGTSSSRRASNIALMSVAPATQASAQTPSTTIKPSSASRDLLVGSKGTDVSTLQLFLSSRTTGPAALALAQAGATGYFGPLTRAALAEFQAREGIAPAAGYFGPRTRAHLQAQGF